MCLKKIKNFNETLKTLFDNDTKLNWNWNPTVLSQLGTIFKNLIFVLTSNLSELRSYENLKLLGLFNFLFKNV